MTTDAPVPAGSFLDRFPRRARLVGGPGDGEDIPLALPAEHPDPPYICTRRGFGWAHYLHDGGGVYVYAAPCEQVRHDGSAPHDHDFGCGQNR